MTNGERDGTLPQSVRVEKSCPVVRSMSEPPSECRTFKCEKTFGSLIAGRLKHMFVLPLMVALVAMSYVNPTDVKPGGKAGRAEGSSGICCVVPAVDTFAKVIVASLPTLVLTVVPVGVVAFLSFPASPALNIEVSSSV